MGREEVGVDPKSVLGKSRLACERLSLSACTSALRFHEARSTACTFVCRASPAGAKVTRRRHRWWDVLVAACTAARPQL
jgi:hypothetical protein